MSCRDVKRKKESGVNSSGGLFLLSKRNQSGSCESAILSNEYLSTLEADIKVNMVYILSPFRDPLHRDRVVFIQNRYCYAIYRIFVQV